MEVLILSKRTALYNLSKEIRSTDTCYYLCDDYLTLLKIRNTLDNKYNVLTLRAIFHKTVKEIENDFLYFCHKINFKNQSEAYWGSHLASRNSASIPLLKNLVYFHSAKELFDHVSSRLILICDSLALIKVLKKEAENHGFSCKVNLLPLENLNLLNICFKLFLRGVYFLTSNIMRWFYARLLKNRRIGDQPLAERYIIRSWTTSGSLDEKNRYKDRNFGILLGYLTQQGKDVWILPMFFNLDKNVFTQMKLMARSGQNFLFPEQYISLIDLVKMLRDGLKIIPLDLDGAEFEGQDLSQIVKEVHLKSCLSPQLMSLNSVKYLIEKFAKKGIRISRFIYPIENNAPEKLFILTARKFYPDSKIIGFQHTVWYKEQLGMFLHPKETNYHPLPHKIICSGRKYLEILKLAGFPQTLLSTGPNLRYPLIREDIKSNWENGLSEGKSILILLNFDLNQNLELLEKTCSALDKFKDIKIYIKPHPLNPVNIIKEFLEYINFPCFQWSSGTVQELVLKVKVVIMAGGSVSNLETISMGVPLLRISMDNNFDFDPLWDNYPFPAFSYSSNETRQIINTMFQLSHFQKERLAQFGREVAENYFEPITYENLKVFL